MLPCIAAHFVRGAWLGCFWCVARVLLPKRFNDLEAPHTVSHDGFPSSINSEIVVGPLQKIADQFTDYRITVVRNNARD